MFIAALTTTQDIFDNAFADVLGTLVGAALLYLIGYVLKKNRDFYNLIKDDHQLVKAHDLIIAQQGRDIKSVLMRLVKIENNQQVAIKEVKRNGGDTDSNGDTTYRTEQKVNQIFEALQNAGITGKEA